jgi:hypothetical protein
MLLATAGPKAGFTINTFSGGITMPNSGKTLGGRTGLLAMIIIIGLLASVVSLGTPATVHGDDDVPNDTVVGAARAPGGGPPAPETTDYCIATTSDREAPTTAEDELWAVYVADLVLASRFWFSLVR